MAKWRTCPVHDIECPFVLTDDSPLPCYGSPEQCEVWRKEWGKVNDLDCILGIEEDI